MTLRISPVNCSNGAIRSFARIGSLSVFASFAALGQTVPADWIGVWTMSPQESKIGAIFGPGLPNGLTVTGQTLKIAAAAGHLKIASDTATSEFGSIHDELEVSLDGKESILFPGVTISFKRLDNAAFDLILKMNNKDGNQAGENRFVFSPDGKLLTETKTHIERETVPKGTDPAKGAEIRSSSSVLVFHPVTGSK
jgi:hypothetical protein